MDFLFNPRVAPSYIVCGSILLLTIGATASKTRLATVAYQSGNSTIATSRANNCRLVGGNDKIVLGAYYFQPDGKGSGSWLSEGTEICDAFGTTARIERGGFAQYLKTGDATEINKTILKRIADEASPDHTPALRVLRDKSIKPYIPPIQTNETDTTGLF